LNDYERSFVAKTTKLKTAGVEFEGLAREALARKFGGAADVLFQDLSPKALEDPEDFVRETSRIFGRGAVGFYEPIMKYVQLGIYGTSTDSPILSLLHQLGPALSGPQGGNAIPLHDHRIKDEEGNYSDEAN
jgi:hypothetical protein